MKNFNSWLAVKVTSLVSSMWCAYVFTALALFALPQAWQDSWAAGTFHPYPIVAWFSMTFIQLVMLSVLAVAMKIKDEASEARHLMQVQLSDHRQERMLEELNLLLGEEGEVVGALRQLLAAHEGDTLCKGVRNG